jgi:hypothetical protein
LDYDPRWGGGSNDPTCTSCHQPIIAQQRSIRIDFANDPHGHRGLSGLYHEECSKPFQSIAHAMNMLSASRF